MVDGTHFLVTCHFVRWVIWLFFFPWLIVKNWSTYDVSSISIQLLLAFADCLLICFQLEWILLFLSVGDSSMMYKINKHFVFEALVWWWKGESKIESFANVLPCLLLVFASYIQNVSDLFRCSSFGQVKVMSWWIKYVKTMYFKHWCDGEMSVKNLEFFHFCHVFAWYCTLPSICFWLHEKFLVWSDEVDIMMNKICKDHVFQALVWWWKCLSKMMKKIC